MAPVTAHPTSQHGTRHGPPGLPARRPSRPTRPASTAPVTAPARTPHGSLHGPPTAPCTAYHGFFAVPSESGFHAWCAGHFLLDSPVKSSSPGFPLVRRSCDDDSEHGSCTAFHGLFTALPGAGARSRDGVLGIGGWSRVKTYKLAAAGRHAQPRERPCRRFLHNSDHDFVRARSSRPSRQRSVAFRGRRAEDDQAS